MNAAARRQLGEIERISGMMGLPEIRVARMLDADARDNARANAERQAQRAAALEAGEAALWAHQHANAEMGLPADTPAAERMRLLNPLSDEPSRNPAAPLGSHDNPARFISSAGGLDAIDGPAQAQARRSWGEALDASLARQARANAEDPFMKVEIARFHARRKVAARRHEPAEQVARKEQDAAAQVAARYEPSGTGWPEITR